jgi:DNA-binding NarL/FixJ family response regulator
MRPCACGLRGATQQAQRASLKGDTDSGQVTARTAALLAALGTGAHAPPSAAHAPRARGARAHRRGLGDRQIAQRLVRSEHTVHRHVSNILSKLGVPSRAAATARAAADGLL